MVVNEETSHEYAQYQQNANVAIFSANVKHWRKSTKKMDIAKRKKIRNLWLRLSCGIKAPLIVRTDDCDVMYTF